MLSFNFFAHSRENATSYYNLLDILITLSNLKWHSLHIKSLTIQQASQQYVFSGTLPLASDCHSHYTRFVSNLNFHRPQINNILTMELPLFLSLRRKYRRLFHWSLKNYVTTASLNTSSYICLIRNLFPRIYH